MDYADLLQKILYWTWRKLFNSWVYCGYNLCSISHYIITIIFSASNLSHFEKPLKTCFGDQEQCLTYSLGSQYYRDSHMTSSIFSYKNSPIKCIFLKSFVNYQYITFSMDFFHHYWSVDMLPCSIVSSRPRLAIKLNVKLHLLISIYMNTINSLYNIHLLFTLLTSLLTERKNWNKGTK